MLKTIIGSIEELRHVLHVVKPLLVDFALLAMLIWELFHFLEKAIVG